MYLLRAQQLNKFSQKLLPDNLAFCQQSLTFIEQKPESSNWISLTDFLYKLLQPDTEDNLTLLRQTPTKAYLSMWQRYWLNHFLILWVYLLHKKRIWIHLNAEQFFLQLSPTGKIKYVAINISFTPISKLAENSNFLPCYQQLKRFFTPIFNQFNQYSKLNVASFWHNASVTLEFALKSLESENVEISKVYQQLFAEKRWSEYEWNPFYHSVEYVDFPKLPFAQPVRLRKVCCHAYLAPEFGYCTNCPKLKKMAEVDLRAVLKNWGLDKADESENNHEKR